MRVPLLLAALLSAVLLLGATAVAAASQPPRLRRITVPARGDSSHFVVWRTRNGLAILPDGDPWNHAQEYPVPPDCSELFVGTGHAGFGCRASDACRNAGATMPRVMDLSTGAFVPLDYSELTRSGCLADPIDQLGSQIIQFSSTCYHCEGYPYSWNWRTGKRVAATEFSHARHHVFDPDKTDGLAELCTPLVAPPAPHELNRVAWFTPPHLVASTKSGLLLERCNSKRVIRLAAPYTYYPDLAVTRRYVAWATRDYLHAYIFRTRQTYRWRVPHAVAHFVSGTNERLLIESHLRYYRRCPCASGFVEFA